MRPLAQALRREARVCFSLRAQPLWFRTAKWLVGLTFIGACHDRPWFWPVVAGWTGLALALHFLYRAKTRAWTQPWGGWDDLAAGRD
jgi:hypothetical protein